MFENVFDPQKLYVSGYRRKNSVDHSTGLAVDLIRPLWYDLDEYHADFYYLKTAWQLFSKIKSGKVLFNRIEAKNKHFHYLDDKKPARYGYEFTVYEKRTYKVLKVDLFSSLAEAKENILADAATAYLKKHKVIEDYQKFAAFATEYFEQKDLLEVYPLPYRIAKNHWGNIANQTILETEYKGLTPVIKSLNDQIMPKKGGFDISTEGIVIIIILAIISLSAFSKKRKPKT